jgi:hypothetical protein
MIMLVLHLFRQAKYRFSTSPDSIFHIVPKAILTVDLSIDAIQSKKGTIAIMITVTTGTQIIRHFYRDTS